jgi:hypothetical protein
MLLYLTKHTRAFALLYEFSRVIAYGLELVQLAQAGILQERRQELCMSLHQYISETCVMEKGDVTPDYSNRNAHPFCRFFGSEYM